MIGRLTLLALLLALPAGAQTVTISKPGTAPTTVDCSGTGCTIAVVPPAPVPPPLPACTFTVTPAALSYPADVGGATLVSVTPSREDCPWGTSGSNEWITLDPRPTLGGALVTVAGGARVARSATLAIAGQAVTVTQGAPIVVPPPPPPTGTVLARMNCDAGWPACGWASWTDVNSPYYRAVRSGNGTRFTFTAATQRAQPYLGWQANFNTTADTIYLRFHLTVHSPFRGNGVGDVWTDKLAIVNNGGTTRAIVQLKPFAAADNSDLSLSTNQNISSNGAPGIALAIGQRHAIQIKVSRGSSVTFAQWVDNADCSRPSSVSAPLGYNPASFNNVGLGFYANASMASSGAVDFTIEDAEVGTACDPGFR